MTRFGRVVAKISYTMQASWILQMCGGSKNHKTTATTVLGSQHGVFGRGPVSDLAFAVVC